MHRIALAVEYNGTRFRGFQRQASAPTTVQAVLENAIARIANESISIVCAGRTDAGVHASEQIVHFDTLATRPDRAWVKGVNASLPDDVRVHWAKEMPASFHARFSALARMYRYVIYCADTRPAILHRAVTWTTYPLSLDKMQEAAKCLVGEHNFSSFRSSQCQAHSPVRNIASLAFLRHGPFIVAQIKANAFLHHMVRNIAGTLIDIGRGARPVEWMVELLRLKDRTRASATASPSGLYLVKAEYDAQFCVPDTPLGPLFLRNH